jgi:hypothetical protein
MALTNVIDRLIADAHDRPLPALTRRRVQLPRLAGKVDAVIGMRRSGKTYFLYQQIRDLAEQGLPRERCLYLNFEDERLAPLTAADLHLIPDAFYRRYPESRRAESWFLFDEIQNVPGWERFVRRLVDSEPVRIVITGSSAKLLAREIASCLRGRSLSTELLPFSFAEALDHVGVEIPNRWPPPARQRSALEHQFQRYLTTGGFPEVQTVAADLRVRILQEYVDVVLLRDVVERHGITNVAALRYVARRLVRSPSGRFSVNRFYNELRSQGIAVGKDALHAYLAHLQDAYFFFAVERATPSLKQRQVNPKKGYLIDHGLAQAAAFQAGDDVGHLLENVVYLEARRRGHTLSYVTTASGFEVDFLVEARSGRRRLLQVCADLADEATRNRELRALEEAMRELKLRGATVVTLRDEQRLSLAGGTVQVVPAWRWLLEPE